MHKSIANVIWTVAIILCFSVAQLTQARWAATSRALLRRAACSSIVGASLFGGQFAMVPPLTIPAVHAANLPESNGAIGNKRGTKEALAPILAMESLAKEAALLRGGGDLGKIKALLSSPALPPTEKAFKRLFDEFSQDVSYKQQYLNSNAFVVYYTKGFDGPGRGSIEQPSAAEALQTQQYFLRNEAWIALDDARAECDYLQGRPGEAPVELDAALGRLLESVGEYVKLAPPPAA